MNGFIKKYLLLFLGCLFTTYSYAAFIPLPNNTLTNNSGIYPYYPPFIALANATEQTPGGILWGAVQRPEVLFNVEPCPTVSGILDNEAAITNAIGIMVTNGWWANITNQVTPVFPIDVGWDAPRNFDYKFDMTNCGTLMWDTNLFPHGIPWLVQWLGNYGAKVRLGIYVNASLIITNPVSGWLCGVSGGDTYLPYTNGVGPGGFIYTNAAYKDVAVSTFQQLNQDMSEIHWWGCEGIVMNDFGESYDQIKAKEDMAAYSAGNFLTYSGFNQVTGSSYWNQNAGAITWSATNSAAWFSSPVQFKNGIFFTNTLALFPFERGVSDVHTLGDITRAMKNGVRYENDESPFSMRAITNFLQDFPGTHKANEGAYIMGNPQIYGIGSYGAGAAVVAFLHGERALPVNNNALTNGISEFTDTGLTALANDPLQELPILVQDWGANVGIMFSEHLAGGDLAIGLESDVSTNNWQPTIPLSLLGLDTNATYQLTFMAGYNAGYGLYGIPQFVKNTITTNIIINYQGDLVARLHLMPNYSTNFNGTFIGTYVGTNGVPVNAPLNSVGVTDGQGNTNFMSVGGTNNNQGIVSIAGLNLNASMLTTGTLPDARLSGNVAKLSSTTVQSFTNGVNLATSGGSVGIGTMSPASTLDVHGTLNAIASITGVSGSGSPFSFQPTLNANTAAAYNGTTYFTTVNGDVSANQGAASFANSINLDSSNIGTLTGFNDQVNNYSGSGVAGAGFVDGPSAIGGEYASYKNYTANGGYAASGGYIANQYAFYVNGLSTAGNNYGLYFNNTPNGGSIASDSSVNITIMPGSGGNVGIGTNAPVTKLQVVGAITPGQYLVSQLPTGTIGAQAIVTDSLTALSVLGVGATLTGGGSNVVPVYYNGSAWVSY